MAILSQGNSLAAFKKGTKDIVAIKSGVFNWKTSVTFFDKVQALQLRQSPFDRRWGMATLSVDTAASGPAVLRFFVFYLDEEFAREEYHSLVTQVALRRPVFG